MKKIIAALLLLVFSVNAWAALPASRTFNLTTGVIPTSDETAWAYNGTSSFTVDATTTTHIRATDNTADVAMHWTGDTFSTDQYSEVTYATVPATAAGTGYGPAVRMTTANTNKTMYRLVCSTLGYELFKLNNGTDASLSGALGTTTCATGDVVRLTIRGSTLSMTKNTIAFGITYTDSTLTTGAPGVAHSSTSGVGAALGIDVWTGSNADGSNRVSIILFQ